GWGDHELVMLLGDVSYGFGDLRTVGTEHCINLVLRDQLLVEASSRFLIRYIIIDHEFNFSSTHSALCVHMLLAQQVSVTNVAALHRVSLASERRRGANPERMAGRVLWRLMRTGGIGHRHHDKPDINCYLFEHCFPPSCIDRRSGC